jgi:hypothetical protein
MTETLQHDHDYRIEVNDNHEVQDDSSSTDAWRVARRDDSQEAMRLLANFSDKSATVASTTEKGKSLQFYYGTWRSVEASNQPSFVVKSNVHLGENMRTIFVVVWALIIVFLLISLILFLI